MNIHNYFGIESSQMLTQCICIIILADQTQWILPHLFFSVSSGLLYFMVHILSLCIIVILRALSPPTLHSQIFTQLPVTCSRGFYYSPCSKGLTKLSLLAVVQQWKYGWGLASFPGPFPLPVISSTVNRTASNNVGDFGKLGERLGMRLGPTQIFYYCKQ